LERISINFLRATSERVCGQFSSLHMDLPKDPFILLSYINTKLRDEYGSLDALCDDMDLDRAVLEKTLAEAGFEYMQQINQFR